MGIIIAFTIGAVVWIVMWAMGAKGFDAMLVFIAIVLVAAGLRVISPYLPGNRSRPDDPSSGGGWVPR